MTRMTILSLKILYKLNTFIILSRELHKFDNHPNQERESLY